MILGNNTDGDSFEFKEINRETQKLKIEEVASQILKAKSNWVHTKKEKLHLDF